MTQDLGLRARDFERQCKLEGLFAVLRQIGVMQYGPATPSPEQDLISIEKLSVFSKYQVLSFDQIKLREVPDGDEAPAGDDRFRTPLIDRQIHAEWLCDAFD